MIMDGFRDFMLLITHLLTLELIVCPSQAGGLSFLFQSGLGEGSHFLTSATIAEALVEKGHHVTYLISNACEYQTSNARWNSKFTFEIFRHSYPPETAMDNLKMFVKSSVDDGLLVAAYKHYSNVLIGGARDCDDLLSDEELMGRLNEAKFDAFIADVVWPCSSILGAKLNRTRIFVNPSGYIAMMADIFGSHVDLAYTPTMVENVPTLPMTFLQRLRNVLDFNLQRIVFVKSFSSIYKSLQLKHDIFPERSLTELQSEADLVLFNMDFVVESKLPLTPNIISVGGLTTKPAKPLPKDLEQFVSGGDGVVVFSLGSYVNHTNERIARNIMNGLAELPFRTVWKFDNKDNLPVPPSIKLMNWLPLNDLLGHYKTKVFVYQGGNNGFYEALYHSVPMVVLPVLGDQGSVASRVVNSNLGKTLDLRVMTSAELQDAIMEVITSKRIQSEVHRVSEIYRDKPVKPLDKAVYWIEHIAKFGGKAYHPTDMGFIQRSLIDVYVFLTVVGLAVVYVLYKVISYVCKCILWCICFRATVNVEKKNR